MSLFNGVVEANRSIAFNTYKEACAFITTLPEGSFEGIQVREHGYIVNYFA
jgi:hypothetical protein